MKITTRLATGWSVKNLGLSEKIGVTTPPTKAATAELLKKVAVSLAHSLYTRADDVVVTALNNVQAKVAIESGMLPSQQSKRYRQVDPTRTQKCRPSSVCGP